MKKQLIFPIIALSLLSATTTLPIKKLVERKKLNISESVRKLKEENRLYKEKIDELRAAKKKDENLKTKCLHINGQEIVTTLAGITAICISIAQFIISVVA